MKRMFEVVLGGVVFALVAVTAFSANPRGTAKLTLNGKTVTVEYGRPALNGRKVEDLLGQVPAGEAWRLGADKSTTFTTTGDLKLGKVTVPKGEYSLFVQKEADGSWKLVFNTQHGQWGVNQEGKANFDPSKNVAAVPLTVEKQGADKSEKAEKPAERVKISLENEKGAGEISIEWGTMELTTTFK
jgi:DUF2911 family protein